MTSHQLAAELLNHPDLPVVINGWGSDEGTAYEVSKLDVPALIEFYPATAFDSLQRALPRPAVALNYDEV